MKNFIYFIILINIVINSANALSDYEAKLVTRSYPAALSLSGSLGYGKEIWGKKGSPLYGYIRPSLQFRTSGVINGAGVQLDIFPISFFGFYGGTKRVFRNIDELGTYDCNLVVCDGRVSRNYLGSKLGLAFKGLFLFFDGKIEDVEVTNRVGIFAEETGTLIAQSGGDQLNQLSSIIGYEVDKELSLGALVQLNKMTKLENETVMSLGFSRLNLKDWSILFGLGQFHTRQSTDHFTALILFTWKGSKGVQLL